MSAVGRVRGRGVRPAVALLLALTLGSSSTSSDDTPSSGGASAATSSAPDPTEAVRSRCGSAMPKSTGVEASALDGASGGSVEVVRIGPARSRAVAVLLPQTSGICGWGPWAGTVAATGVTSLLVSPCGYGESECPPEADADPLNEVAAAAAYARSELGARRVVLVGTSMGGSLTVVAAAAGADVDAWVDVSGPDEWFPDRPLHELAPTLRERAPGMVVYAHSEGSVDFGLARDLAQGAGARFVPADSGHGYDLLTDVDGALTRMGRAVLAFAAATG